MVLIYSIINAELPASEVFSDGLTVQSTHASHNVSPSRSFLQSQCHVSASEPQLHSARNLSQNHGPSLRPTIHQAGCTFGTAVAASPEVHSHMLDSQLKGFSHSTFDYILLPLHLTFYFTNDTGSKDVTAR